MSEDYKIQPVTQSCSSSVTVVATPPKSSDQQQQISKIDATTYQIQQNQSMDTIEAPKSLVGSGKKSSTSSSKRLKTYTLLFYRKKYTIRALDEKDALHLFFKNKTYAKPHTVYINKQPYTVTPSGKSKALSFTPVSNKTSLR
jgi:hypothetical protein